MDIIPIGPNNEYIFALQGAPNRPFTGTMTISSTVNAYIASKGDGSFQLCTRTEAVPGAGASIAVDVTVLAVDELGAVITPLVIPFVLNGPALPPPASAVVLINGVEVTKLNNPSPPDPGSATIAI